MLYGKGPLPSSRCHLDNGKLRTFPTEVIPQPFQISHFTKCKRTLPTYETWALGKKMSDGGHASIHIRCVRVCLRAGVWTRSDVLSHHTLASYVAVCLCMVLLRAHLAPNRRQTVIQGCRQPRQTSVTSVKCAGWAAILSGSLLILPWNECLPL